MVDFRRRAERRREFYDRIRSDPAAFLQIHGSQLKIHIDANLSSAADSSLMPWMGDNSNMIDRFDVRAHLDRLDIANNTSNDDIPSTPEEEALERQMNYERYRNLVQNEFLGLNETKFLSQIYHEERFGAPKDYPQNKGNQKKKLAESKAAIGFDYEEVDYSSQTIQTKNAESESEESSDDDYDFDTTVNIDQLDNEAGHRINSIALKFGMKNDDFVKYLDEDKTEAEKLRLQKEIENEKSMFTGRKSRRERRALKEQRLLILRAANVEETAKISLKKPETEKHQSSSDSEMSVDETKIEFITSFGGSSEDETPKESVEKKQKQEVIKRKQKIKALISQKTEPIPVVYGPTLPGEDVVCPTMSTSFNKSSHSKQRTYRFNDSNRRSRSKSRSRSRERSRLRKDSRHYSRRSRSTSRSVENWRSSKRTPDRYHHRRRSPARDRRRSRSRSRNRRTRSSRSRDRDRDRWGGSRRRSLSRIRTRSPNRHRMNSRRSKSRDESRSRRRTRSKSRSRSRRRSRSRDRERGMERDRVRKREVESKRDDSSPKHSPSKSQNKFTRNEEIISVLETNTKVIDDTNSEQPIRSVPSEADISEISEPKEETNCETNDSKNNELSEPTEEQSLRVPSPPIKSYYRHDLCDSELDSEDEARSKGQKTEKDEEKR